VFSLPGVSRGDTVAVIASNTPEMNECHFGIPMTGAVILAINTRLDPAAVAFILEHSEAKFLITDTEVCYKNLYNIPPNFSSPTRRYVIHKPRRICN
jgi:acyl-CoA synthetase (AMP-forming)/AMP-acid ligase II